MSTDNDCNSLEPVVNHFSPTTAAANDRENREKSLDTLLVNHGREEVAVDGDADKELDNDSNSSECVAVNDPQPPPTRPKRCTNCGTTSTSLWRRNTQAEIVCNACGVYYKLHGVNRPVELRNDDIQSRRRVSRQKSDSSHVENNAKVKRRRPPRPGCCSNCGTTMSTLWRHDSEGQVVCNACGLYNKQKGASRPVELRKDDIQQRNRKRRQDPSNGHHDTEIDACDAVDSVESVVCEVDPIAAGGDHSLTVSGRRVTRKRKQVNYDVSDEEMTESDAIDAPNSRKTKLTRAPMIELNAAGGAKLRQMMQNAELLEEFMSAFYQEQEQQQATSEKKEKKTRNKPEVVYPDMRPRMGKTVDVYTVASVVQTLKQWFIELNKHLMDVHGLRVQDPLSESLAKATGELKGLDSCSNCYVTSPGMTRATLFRYLNKNPKDNEPPKKGQPCKVTGRDLELLKEVVRERLPSPDEDRPPTVRDLLSLFLARKQQQDPKYKLSNVVFRQALKKAKFRWRKKYIPGQRAKYYVSVELLLRQVHSF